MSPPPLGKCRGCGTWVWRSDDYVTESHFIWHEECRGGGS